MMVAWIARPNTCWVYAAFAVSSRQGDSQTGSLSYTVGLKCPSLMLKLVEMARSLFY